MTVISDGGRQRRWTPLFCKRLFMQSSCHFSPFMNMQSIYKWTAYLRINQSICKWTGIIYKLSKIHASTTTWFTFMCLGENENSQLRSSILQSENQGFTTIDMLYDVRRRKILVLIRTNDISVLRKQPYKPTPRGVPRQHPL